MAETVAQAKQRARQHFKELRGALGAAERERLDAQVAQRLWRLPEFERASLVLSYLSVGDEVDTRATIREAWRQGKTVAIPCCVPGSRLLEWYAIEDFEGLEVSRFGILEPVPIADLRVLPPAPGSAQSAGAIALVPGLAFDKEGYRLGYGGGYYDTFLAAFGGAAIGLCRSCQLSEQPLPRDAHDCAVDAVVSELGVMRVCAR